MRKNHPLTIVQVNTADIGGGAEKVSFSLHKEYRRLGHKSILLVGKKRSDEPDVLEIDNRGFNLIKVIIGKILGRITGRQYLSFPGSHRIQEIIGKPFDILHFHNLHGGYFDITALPKLSQIAPILITLHDMWLLTGHCAYPFDCERWKNGCEKCPNLFNPPATFRDGSRFNWLRKKRNLSLSSPVFFCPSQWLLEKVRESYLKDFPAHLVYNGIDLEIFKPGSKVEARKSLGLPRDKKILLFLSNRGLNNPRKDPHTLIKALRYLVNRNLHPHLFPPPSRGRTKERGKGNSYTIKLLVVGQRGPSPDLGELNNFIIYRPFISDDEEIANYYRASDISIHLSLADNCPLTILEAMACGIPVVASRVGGIPELIENNKNGILVEPKNSEKLTAGLRRLLENPSEGEEMGKVGRDMAEKQFDIREQTKHYLNWYENLCYNFQNTKKI